MFALCVMNVRSQQKKYMIVTSVSLHTGAGAVLGVTGAVTRAVVYTEVRGRVTVHACVALATLTHAGVTH